MKNLAALFLMLPMLLNAREIKTVNFPVGNDYFVFATCQKTDNNDSEITLGLGKNIDNKNSIVRAIGPEGGCDSISQNDFDGDGTLDISIVYGNQPTSSERIFLVDIGRKLIIDSGAIPASSSKLNDGSYLYEEISYGSKSRSIYIFYEKKLLKTKQLNLCLTERFA